MNNNEDTKFHLTATEVVLPGRVEPSGLQIRKRALMPPRPGQALVQMEASGVSFAEQTMRRGRYPSQPAFPFVPGYDFVGTIIAVGAGVGRERVGTRVAAVTKTGGWATHNLVPAQELVPVPEGLIRQRRRRYSSNGITAWQMHFRQAGGEGRTDDTRAWGQWRRRHSFVPDRAPRWNPGHRDRCASAPRRPARDGNRAGGL
jgi:NADPH:quinone reductase-like Zn-dependent oxidoreductase